MKKILIVLIATTFFTISCQKEINHEIDSIDSKSMLSERLSNNEPNQSYANDFIAEKLMAGENYIYTALVGMDADRLNHFLYLYERIDWDNSFISYNTEEDYIVTVPLIKENEISGFFKLYQNSENDSDDFFILDFYSTKEIRSKIETSLDARDEKIYKGLVTSLIYIHEKMNINCDPQYQNWLDTRRNRGINERTLLICYTVFICSGSVSTSTGWIRCGDEWFPVALEAPCCDGYEECYVIGSINHFPKALFSGETELWDSDSFSGNDSDGNPFFTKPTSNHNPHNDDSDPSVKLYPADIQIIKNWLIENDLDPDLSPIIFDCYSKESTGTVGSVDGDCAKEAIINEIFTKFGITDQETKDMIRDNPSIWKIFTNKLVSVDEVPETEIKLLECNSFRWTQTGQGWISCLDPNVIDIEVGNLEIPLDLGFSFTIPKTRKDENGEIYQTISDDEASACAAAAANFATIAVKQALNFAALAGQNPTSYRAQLAMPYIYKDAYNNFIKGTPCGYGKIASCNAMNCPDGAEQPTYSDNFVDVTREILLEGCQ